MGLAAIDIEDIAGDERRFVRRDEDNRVGNLLREAPLRPGRRDADELATPPTFLKSDARTSMLTPLFSSMRPVPFKTEMRRAVGPVDESVYSGKWHAARAVNPACDACEPGRPPATRRPSLPTHERVVAGPLRRELAASSADLFSGAAR